MSELTEDQSEVLLAWAKSHPRLEQAMTVGLFADLHRVVGDMIEEVLR